MSSWRCAAGRSEDGRRRGGQSRHQGATRDCAVHVAMGMRRWALSGGSAAWAIRGVDVRLHMVTELVSGEVSGGHWPRGRSRMRKRPGPRERRRLNRGGRLNATAAQQRREHEKVLERNAGDGSQCGAAQIGSRDDDGQSAGAGNANSRLRPVPDEVTQRRSAAACGSTERPTARRRRISRHDAVWTEGQRADMGAAAELQQSERLEAAALHRLLRGRSKRNARRPDDEEGRSDNARQTWRCDWRAWRRCRQ